MSPRYIGIKEGEHIKMKENKKGFLIMLSTLCSNSSRGLLLGERCEPQVRPDDAELREKLLSQIVAD